MTKPKIIIYTDGGSRGNPGVAGAGALITNTEGKVLAETFQALGVMTNNEAEYQGVILGLGLLKKTINKDQVHNYEVELRLDSELVANQLKGTYQLKEEKLFPLFIKIWNLQVKDLPKFSIKHIPREENALADKLANRAMDESGGLKQALL